MILDRLSWIVETRQLDTARATFAIKIILRTRNSSWLLGPPGPHGMRKVPRGTISSTALYAGCDNQEGIV
jgi:hypothetical protein